MGQDILSSGESAREVPPLEKLSDTVASVEQSASVIDDPLVSHLVSALRLRLEDLQKAAVPRYEVLPFVRKRYLRPFNGPKPLADLAASLTSVVANHARPLRDDVADRFRLWSEQMGIHFQSHRERVAAVLERYVPFVDTLAGAHVDRKPIPRFQAYRDKARNVAAITVWYYDPESGDFETLLRQNIAEGFAHYEKDGSKWSPQWQEHGGSQVGVRDVQNNDPPLPVPVMFSTDQWKALSQWACQHEINASTPYSIRRQIAQICYPRVFAYATKKNPGQPLDGKLKTVAHDSLMRCVNAFDPREHGDNFATYAFPLIFADIDCAWAAMQKNNASDGDSPMESTNANVQDASMDSSVEAPVPAMGTAPVPSDAIVEHGGTSDDVPQGVEPNIATTGTNTAGAAATVASHCTDEDQISTVSRKTLSKLQRRKDDAAARNNHPPGAAIDVASSSIASTASSDAEGEQWDAAALAECNRQAAVVDYVRRQEQGGSYVHLYHDALTLLIDNNGKTATTDARKSLDQLGVKHPKSKAVQAAADTILSSVAATFAPLDGTQKYFRGLLSDAIKNGIEEEYKKHR